MEANLKLEQPKFWSDDFDMDLLKVFPETTAILGELADTKLWTVGHESFGRLNHPCVWNSHGAFIWLKKPNLERDSHGWYNVHGCVANEPEIECTWLELLRDQWPHSYNFVLLLEPRFVGAVRFPGPPETAFMQIMYDLRGWCKSTNLQLHRNESLKWLTRVNQKLKSTLEKQR
jgi:hypothetical protein